MLISFTFIGSLSFISSISRAFAVNLYNLPVVYYVFLAFILFIS